MDTVIMRRVDDGRALRAARKDAGMTMQQLAAATRLVDPDGTGIGFQLISLLESPKKYGRKTTTRKTATLIALALKVPREDLFTEDTLAAGEHVIAAVPDDADQSWEAL